MKIDSIKFKGHRCFKNEWVGFDTIKPINVIIGRNNTGKSHLLELARVCCKTKLEKTGYQLKLCGKLDEESLIKRFNRNSEQIDRTRYQLVGHYGPILDDWSGHGIHLNNEEVAWEVNQHGQIQSVRTCRSTYIGADPPADLEPVYKERIGPIVESAFPPLAGKEFKHLLADRDIQPEEKTNNLELSESGEGATNIIRRFLSSADANLPRSVIQDELLSGLKLIFGSDGNFTEIVTFDHDYDKAKYPDRWEVYLGEEHKEEPISLSQSGSGLKTVILVLLNLIVVPVIEKGAQNNKGNYVFAFEELENNLHPALLRRLLAYIESYAKKHGSTFFLTTHSSVTLDFFRNPDSAQIIHVMHDGNSATASTVSAHFDKIGLVAELGAKPSDLLQANGIVWVEGPSDRVYINHWVELLSGGQLQEGRDYQCAFYGGALLARTEAKAAEEEKVEENRVNLLRVNPNIYLVCDGDRDGPKKLLKGRVQRMEEEISKIPGANFWATQGREIENYIPGEIISKVQGAQNLPDPEKCERFFGSQTSKRSYLQDHLKIRKLDKTQFAIECVKHMTLENMKPRFDWKEKVTEIVQAIRKWNE